MRESRIGYESLIFYHSSQFFAIIFTRRGDGMRSRFQEFAARRNKTRYVLVGLLVGGLVGLIVSAFRFLIGDTVYKPVIEDVSVSMLQLAFH